MIKVVLFLLLLLWAVKAPYPYRDSVRTDVMSKNPEVILAKENGEIVNNFLQATSQMKPGDQRRNQAIAALALVRSQQLQINDAERLYRVILAENKSKSDPDDYLAQIKMKLAASLLDEARFDEAIFYYREVLAKDQERVPKNSTFLARDYNNLGLASYLKASSKDRGQERTQLLNSANDFYKQALTLCQSPKTKNQTKAVILYNQHLAMRDLTDLTAANLAKTEADAIDETFGRASKLP